MSDHGNESYNPLDPPPHIKAIIEHQQMHAEVNAHERQQWIESLDEEGLIEFRSILHDSVNSEGKSALYWIGFTTSLLQNMGMCAGCGKKHDEELKNIKSDDEIAAEFEANLETYNLQRADHGQLACKNCGKLYVSLEDRMLRSPGTAGCDGCLQKEKWG